MYTSRRDRISWAQRWRRMREDIHSRLSVTKIRESYDDPTYSDIKLKSEGMSVWSRQDKIWRGRTIMAKDNKTDTNIDDVIGLSSGESATQSASATQVASERILTDISGVAPVNNSKSVETQDTVILTDSGSRPNSRHSNTVFNTQEKPSSSKTLNS